ncbi:MAG: response regulator transcription factor [Verrucomicrobiales bacterium]|nr:response regulator transcription factor [Verrucomicrobiales bacterium]
MSSAPQTIYLVDDDPGVLKGLSRLLRSAGLQAVAFSCPEAFLAHVEPRRAGCLVLDYTMPGLNGLELQAALHHKGCLLPIIFLSGNGDVPTSVQAMKRGAIDFLTKPVSDAHLLGAIHSALERSRRDLQGLAEREELRARVDSLTCREQEVFHHVVAGRLNKQIAAELGTVEQTVKVHRARVMEKMKVQSVAELARIAERLGLGLDLPSRSEPPASPAPRSAVH